MNKRVKKSINYYLNNIDSKEFKEAKEKKSY